MPDTITITEKESCCGNVHLVVTPVFEDGMLFQQLPFMEFEDGDIMLFE